MGVQVGRAILEDNLAVSIKTETACPVTQQPSSRSLVSQVLVCVKEGQHKDVQNCIVWDNETLKTIVKKMPPGTNRYFLFIPRTKVHS